MRFQISQLNIHWHGVDDDTPEGHALALGTDPLGSTRLFLFAGETPTDAGFRGSVLVPHPESASGPIAYGRSGEYVAHIASQGSVKALLARLTDEHP